MSQAAPQVYNRWERLLYAWGACHRYGGKDGARIPGEILRIIDGDTLKARVDLGFYVHVEVTLRLARVNTPEMDELPGQLARAFVCQELEPVTMLRVTTSKTGKYGRWIAEVAYQIRGQPGVWHNLSDRIVAEGHGQWTPS